MYIDADSIITRRPSGIGSMTVQLIHALSENSDFVKTHRIILFAPINKIGLIKQWDFNEHVEVRALPLIGRLVSILYKTRLLPPIDLWLGRGVYLFPNFRRLPVVASRSITYIHDVSFRVYPEYVEAKNLSFLMKHTNDWIRKSDKIITVSNHAKQEIVKYYPEADSKIEVVHNGISTSFAPQGEEAVQSTLGTYGLEYKNYFMFLSNLEPRKNVHGLLEAYELFLAHNKTVSVKLLLVGGMGWNNEDILKKIDMLNSEKKNVVVPEKYVPDHDLPALLSGAVALVHPAHYEGFGISPLQAMACGTQVVAANNTSIPEVVGDGGIYVNENDRESIFDGMTVAYNKRYDLNEKGVRKAADFTWVNSAERLKSIVVEVEDN